MTVLTDLLPVSLIMAERKLQVSGEEGMIGRTRLGGDAFVFGRFALVVIDEPHCVLLRRESSTSATPGRSATMKYWTCIGSTSTRRFHTLTSPSKSRTRYWSLNDLTTRW